MGKYSILIVFTLAVMLGVILPNVHSLGHRAVENYIEYAMRTQSHHLAVSGANAAATQIFLDPGWRSGFGKTKASGGSFEVNVSVYDTMKIRIQSIGEFENLRDTVTVLLQPSSFAHYAYYSKVEGAITWITGDTVWGPFHTQDVMRTAGTPVIRGPATTLKGTNPSPSAAKFEGGYLDGVSIDLPLDLSYTENGAASGGRVFATGDVWLNFLGDQVEWKTSAAGPPTIVPISTFAPNGVILAKEGSFHLKGVLDGRVTLCALGDGSLNQGNIYIEDDIEYAHDPRTGGTGNILGLIADNDVIIEENPANISNVVIQASIFCRTGGLTAENYATRPVSGILDLLGGIIQYKRGAVGTFSSSGGIPVIKTGFRKNYLYDDRFYL
ncbi:MAG TPA: hypothetical protein VJO14_00550, partial [Bacteroidota bacterium]|nr:hypothetical protein [Bacteroidota bacterium]